MAEKKGSSRGSIIVAGVVFGGLVAVEAGQHLSHAVQASEQLTLIAVAAGALVGGAGAFLATRGKRGQPALR